MRAYIFDLDGTLLDSMGVWEQVDKAFLAKRGLAVPDDYVDAVCARSFPEAAAYTIERFGLPESVEDLMREWRDLAEYAYGHTVPLKPHAGEYLRELKGRGAKLGVATGLTLPLCEAALRNNGVWELFDAVCSTDETAWGKTRPDVYLLAAKRLGAEPRECVVFEDLPEGILSAKAAGMTVYGVYDEYSRAHWEFVKSIADGVICGFKDAPL